MFLYQAVLEMVHQILRSSLLLWFGGNYGTEATVLTAPPPLVYNNFATRWAFNIPVNFLCTKHGTCMSCLLDGSVDCLSLINITIQCLLSSYLSWRAQSQCIKQFVACSQEVRTHSDCGVGAWDNMFCSYCTFSCLGIHIHIDLLADELLRIILTIFTNMVLQAGTKPCEGHSWQMAAAGSHLDGDLASKMEGILDMKLFYSYFALVDTGDCPRSAITLETLSTCQPTQSPTWKLFQFAMCFIVGLHWRSFWFPGSTEREVCKPARQNHEISITFWNTRNSSFFVARQLHHELKSHTFSAAFSMRMLMLLMILFHVFLSALSWFEIWSGVQAAPKGALLQICILQMALAEIETTETSPNVVVNEVKLVRAMFSSSLQSWRSKSAFQDTK